MVNLLIDNGFIVGSDSEPGKKEEGEPRKRKELSLELFRNYHILTVLIFMFQRII